MFKRKELLSNGFLPFTQTNNKNWKDNFFFLFVTLGFLLFAFTANYGLAFAPLLGVAFPDFLAWEFAFYVMAALANAIITFTLSPFVLRENQESSYILSVQSIFEEN